MARSDAPFGFRLARRQDNVGSPSQNPYYVDSSDTTPLFIGDPVVLDGGASSEVTVVGGGKFPAGTLAGVTRATAGAGSGMIGVVVGVAAATQESTVYRAASTERVVYVCDDPNALWEVQADDAVAAASVGLNTQILFTHSGSTVTGISGAEVDATVTADTGGTAQCQVVGVLNRGDVTVNTAGNILVVRFNLHQRTGTGAVGV